MDSVISCEQCSVPVHTVEHPAMGGEHCFYCPACRGEWMIPLSDEWGTVVAGDSGLTYADGEGDSS